MVHELQTIVRKTRFQAAAWFIPVLVLGAALHWAVLPMAERIQVLNNDIARGKQNVYEQAWIDSVNIHLQEINTELSAFFKDLKVRISNYPSIQSLSDELRQLFSSNGLTVLKTRPVVSSKGKLSNMSVRVDGNGDFASLVSLFGELSMNQPWLSIDNLTVRKTRSGLSFAITVSAWASRTGRYVVFTKGEPE